MALDYQNTVEYFKMLLSQILLKKFQFKYMIKNLTEIYEYGNSKLVFLNIQSSSLVQLVVQAPWTMGLESSVSDTYPISPV